MNFGMVITAVIVILLAWFFFGQKAALTSESSAYTLCSKVSDHEASCNFYNRGASQGYGPDSAVIPDFQTWAKSHNVSYDTCMATVQVAAFGMCSNGPGSGTYGTPCCNPTQTDVGTSYSATGNSCPLKFNGWYALDATCKDNGGGGVSYSGNVRFYSKSAAPSCGKQWSCSTWSTCTSYYAQTRVCTDECSNSRTDTQVCGNVNGNTPIPTPTVILPTPTPTPSTSSGGLLEWVISFINSLINSIKW